MKGGTGTAISEKPYRAKENPLEVYLASQGILSQTSKQLNEDLYTLVSEFSYNGLDIMPTTLAGLELAPKQEKKKEKIIWVTYALSPKLIKVIDSSWEGKLAMIGAKYHLDLRLPDWAYSRSAR